MNTLSINSHLNVNNNIVSHNSSMSIILPISNNGIRGIECSPMSHSQREQTLL